jgi:hypothetical protein
MMIKQMRKCIKHQILLITCLVSASTGVLAAEYVPPPAGPYKPAVVMSDSSGTSTDDSGKVYKFPNDDLMRSEAPPMPVLVPPRKEPVKTVHNERLNAGSEMQKKAAKAPTFSSQSPANIQNPANSYAVNPWAAGAFQSQSSVAPPRYQSAQQPGQAWYPPYGYPQQNPYAYGYPNYYGNSNNSADAPFSTMPSPWTMMPMQPFFSGR